MCMTLGFLSVVSGFGSANATVPAAALSTLQKQSTAPGPITKVMGYGGCGDGHCGQRHYDHGSYGGCGDGHCGQRHYSHGYYGYGYGRPYYRGNDDYGYERPYYGSYAADAPHCDD